MEAKDTVMSDEEIDGVICLAKSKILSSWRRNRREAILSVARAQAEISFRAGYEKGMNDNKWSFVELEEAKQAGKKEIVDFVVDKIFPMLDMASVPVAFKDRWNARVKNCKEV